jgi:GntR family transcriptional regulator / MocR family aminotransferase
MRRLRATIFPRTEVCINIHLSPIRYYHFAVVKHAPPSLVPVISIDRGLSMPLYRQLYAGFREAILESRLRAGQRVPSTRALAEELGISRLPVVNAFEQLVAEGYFESGIGSGTFVAKNVPGKTVPAPKGASARATSQRRRTESPESDFLVRKAQDPWLGGRGAFRVSQPAVDRFPFPAWARLVGRHAREMRRSPASLHYGHPMGDRAFREAIATYLRTARAVRCEAEQIMVVAGSQQALDLTARVLLDRGSPVWVEEPGYLGVRDVLRLRGAEVVPVPVDGQGLEVAAGIELNARARAAYVTPSHEYPLGMTMTLSRRLELLDWARRNGAWIIEDDYDSEYRYESLPIASLQGLDRDARVIYIGTFSKVLFPSLRVGYIVIPEDLVSRFAAVRAVSDDFPPLFVQSVLAEFLEAGHFARHVRRTRALYRERRSALVQAIEGELSEDLDVVGGEAGMHLVALLRRGGGDHALSVRAARRGIWAMPLSSCYFGNPTRQGFVLGFSGTDVSELRAGVRALSGILRE